MCFKESSISCTFRATTIVFIWLSVFSSIICGSLYFTKNIIEISTLKVEGFNKSTTFFYYIGDVVTGIIGLYGIFKKKPRCLLLFFIYKVFDLIWMIILVAYNSSHLTFLPLTLLKLIFNAIFVGNTNFSIHDEAAILVLGCLIFVLGVKIYFTVILYQYYHVLYEQILFKGKVFARVKPEETCYVNMS